MGGGVGLVIAGLVDALRTVAQSAHPVCPAAVQSA
jgi:hypothetical protein